MQSTPIFTSTQQAALEAAEGKRQRLWAAVQEATGQHGWTGPEATEALEAYSAAEGFLTSLRAAIVGSGVWAEDGGAVVGAFHQGPESGSVYYERYELGVRTAHGWVDAISRRITQTG